MSSDPCRYQSLLVVRVVRAMSKCLNMWIVACLVIGSLACAPTQLPSERTPSAPEASDILEDVAASYRDGEFSLELERSLAPASVIAALTEVTRTPEYGLFYRCSAHWALACMRIDAEHQVRELVALATGEMDSFTGTGVENDCTTPLPSALLSGYSKTNNLAFLRALVTMKADGAVAEVRWGTLLESLLLYPYDTLEIILSSELSHRHNHGYWIRGGPLEIMYHRAKGHNSTRLFLQSVFMGALDSGSSDIAALREVMRYLGLDSEE